MNLLLDLCQSNDFAYCSRAEDLSSTKMRFPDENSDGEAHLIIFLVAALDGNFGKYLEKVFN